MFTIKKFFLFSLCIFSTHTWAESGSDWFIEKSSLTNAHKALLEGDLEKSFDSMVQTWQKEPNNNIKTNLNQLLNKALDNDCGRTFDSAGFPSWLDTVIIERQTIQNPGRVNYRLNLNIQSSRQLSLVRFTKWPDIELINQKLELKISEKASKWPYNHSIDMNAQMDTGLYKIKLKTEGGEEWESWVILSQRHSKRVVRWTSNSSWIVEKKALLNQFCPFPVLTVSLSGSLDGEYKNVWQHNYEINYPESVPDIDLPPDRYLLSVSITHKRWQGPIMIEDTQLINKAYDITN